jgi:hypothetical protein
MGRCRHEQEACPRAVRRIAGEFAGAKACFVKSITVGAPAMTRIEHARPGWATFG